MSDQWIDQLSQWIENNNEQWLGQEEIITISGVTSDVSAYIKSFIQSYSDLSAEAKAIYYSDVNSIIHGLDTRDLSATIRAFLSSDISGFIDTHSPIDIQALLNVIEIRDIASTIMGEWPHGSVDIGAEFYKIWNRGYKSLQTLIHGFAIVDLPSYINAVYYSDIPANIVGGLLKDLAASIGIIPPSNLQGLIHGFDTVDLPSLLNGVYGPGDIQAFVNVVRPFDLSARIAAYKGIETPYNLLASIVGGYSVDLAAYLGGVNPINLRAYITAIQKIIDLPATIIPSTILMKKVIQVPLLEHKDLTAIVNFMCFNSSYANLPSYLYTIHKSDLSAYIISWFGGTADHLKDLKAYVNASTYTAQDRMTFSYIPEVPKYTRLNLSFTAPASYYTWDTINVRFANYRTKDLLSSITGVLRSVNLGASLTPTWDWNYSQLPNYVKPKTHEVFINVEKFEEQWRRFVELMFDKDGTNPFKYFYVSGTEKVYKIDRSRHWTIWADGYNKVENSLIEKANVRRKFIFRMSDYSTMDEAIRDLIERAAYPTYVNLGAYIDGGLSPYIDLSAIVDIKHVHKWIKNLSAGIRVTNLILINSNMDLGAYISSGEEYYIPLDGDSLLFNFEDVEVYTPPVYNEININWGA